MYSYVEYHYFRKAINQFTNCTKCLEIKYFIDIFQFINTNLSFHSFSFLKVHILLLLLNFPTRNVGFCGGQQQKCLIATCQANREPFTYNLICCTRSKKKNMLPIYKLQLYLYHTCKELFSWGYENILYYLYYDISMVLLVTILYEITIRLLSLLFVSHNNSKKWKY